MTDTEWEELIIKQFEISDSLNRHAERSIRSTTRFLNSLARKHRNAEMKRALMVKKALRG